MPQVVNAFGGGYLGKSCHSLTKDMDSMEDTLVESSNNKKSRLTPSTESIQGKSFSFCRLAWKKRQREVASVGEKVPDEGLLEAPQSLCASRAEFPWNIGFDGQKLSRLHNFDDAVVHSVAISPLDRKKSGRSCLEIEGRDWPNADAGINFSGSPLEPSIARLGSFNGSLRVRRSLRSVQSSVKFSKQLSSLETCLLSQLFEEQTKMEECIRSSLPSPSTPNITPRFVTDGCVIIGEESKNFHTGGTEVDKSKQLRDTYVESNESIVGLPPLPIGMSVEPPRVPWEIKPKTANLEGQNFFISSKTTNGRHSSNSQGDNKLLLCLGISFGIISSVLANKQEVEKLRALLKQTENLVQDLQEEMEMKESITVKELVSEGYDLQDTCNRSFHNVEPSAVTPSKDLREVRGVDKHSENMKTIEAELEAELERLELSMNASNIHNELPDLLKFDSEHVASVMHGELRADMFAEDGVQTDSHDHTSSTSTTCSANYAVSPQELSLRLYEVIQSRLENRVRELETALENSERKVKDLESKQMYTWRELSDSETVYSPSHEGEITCKEYSRTVHPDALNFSEESLSALQDFEEERVRCGAYENQTQGELDLFDQSSTSSLLTVDKEIPEEISTLKQWGPNDSDTSSDENDDGSEMEKLLIKQIVEKTKQGSPALLNAQRAFFSRIETENQKYEVCIEQDETKLWIE